METEACRVWAVEATDTPCNVYDPGCPGRVVLDRIGDRWTVLIVGVLVTGTKRFSELRDAVGGITPKVLTQTLRAMERDGLVTRTVYAVVPPKVECALTDFGRSLIPAINEIRIWAETNTGELFDNRARYDTAHS